LKAQGDSLNWRRSIGPGLESWLKLNADYALAWPNITIKREPPADAKEFDGVPGKFEQYFSSNPGQGD
jgi:ferredoxin